MQKDVIEKLMKEMLNSSIIRYSANPYSNLVVFVKKKDDTWRMCINYRTLNQTTIKDRYPIPLIEEVFDKLGKVVIFSKIDLRSGWWQIRMHPSLIAKTTFKTHEGHYEFLVMSFSLTNASSTFQNIMNCIFKPHLRKFVLVFFFLINILVYS